MYVKGAVICWIALIRVTLYLVYIQGHMKLTIPETGIELILKKYGIRKHILKTQPIIE